MKRKSLVIGLAGLLIAQAPVALAQSNDRPKLIVAAESQEMIWNAVATDHERVFVAGPRWAGARGPAVALIDRNGRPQPYPDEAWNGWTPTADASRVFVSVNALRRDRDGGLWAVDTGAPDFGGSPLPGGAKVVRIDLATNRVDRVFLLGPQVVLAGSYVDDIRFNRGHAYLTDAGRPGLIVLDLKSGDARRVLDGAKVAMAPSDRSIVIGGKVVTAPDGSPLRVNSDPLEVSPNGRWVFFGPLEGPWSMIETRWLDDPSLSPDVLVSKVRAWANLPPVGGTVMDANGDLYFTDLAEDSLKRRTPNGEVMTLVQDSRLHWADAPFIDADHVIWLPVPQLDRIALFNGGRSQTRWPVQLFRLDLGPAR